MCGISGLLTKRGQSAPQGALDIVTDRISHRGPDARGTFSDPEAGIHLGHRRLSIVDLSPSGAQPMVSSSGRYVIVLNGEIYNFQEIRGRLDATTRPMWRGTSDTEALIEAIEAWGIEKAVQMAEGMFAFALWDRKGSRLTLARDRFGEKPLFVGECPDGLVFASELRSIMSYPGFSGQTDDEATDLFLTLSYIPEPLTPFKNVWKVPAASMVHLAPGDRTINPLQYWDAVSVAHTARTEAMDAGAPEDQLIASIEDRLSTVVANQMIADVPLGAFLSGGIDSSLIVAMMKNSTSRPVQTFTIGFKDEAYDEAPYARAVAHHLGTDHTELTLDWQDALDIVHRLPEIYDEPFADSSQIPTHLVSRMAKQSVTVCLSGDGGDEVFGGYNRHRFSRSYHRFSSLIPKALHPAMGRALAAIAEPKRFTRMEAILSRASARKRMRLPGEKLNKLAMALRSADTKELYSNLIRRDEGLMRGARLSESLDPHFSRVSKHDFDLAEEMMLMDTLTYLPGDILTKVDRAAMSVALETRIPFLDHQLFALAWSLPITTRIHNGQTKSVLRTILAKHVPPDLFERPKAGFGIPLDAWLKGPLRNDLETHCRTFIQTQPRHEAMITRALDDFIAGRGHLHHFLWNVFMFEAWRKSAFQTNGLRTADE